MASTFMSRAKEAVHRVFANYQHHLFAARHNAEDFNAAYQSLRNSVWRETETRIKESFQNGLAEVHPKKFADFDPLDPRLDTEGVHTCWLHVTERDGGQHVACLEYHDHDHGSDNVLCVALNLEVDTWRAINGQLFMDDAYGRSLHQNALNDLATQIVRQMELNAPRR